MGLAFVDLWISSFSAPLFVLWWSLEEARGELRGWVVVLPFQISLVAARGGDVSPVCRDPLGACGSCVSPKLELVPYVALLVTGSLSFRHLLAVALR